MGEAYLTLPPGVLDMVKVKTQMISFNDEATWPNGPSSSPYRNVIYTLNFEPDEVSVTFTALSASTWGHSSNMNVTEYHTTGATMTLAQGSVVNLMYGTRSQGSTTCRLYYQIGLSGKQLFYQESYNYYNEWTTHSTTATAKCIKY